MQRLCLTDLQRRCQKPDHRRIGNWMARRITRPLALRVTRVVAPWGVSANAVTLAAWGCGAAAAAAFGWGTAWAWLLGAGLLQAWYLLDHVDGQLARLRGVASLDGVQLDYVMHHTINLLVPLGVGFGLFVRGAEPLWLLGGLAWGLSLLLLTLQHDARYKAFIQRLKRLQGRLYVEGGGGGRPLPQPPVPASPLRLAAWITRKACEMHVVMNLLSVVAVGQVLVGDRELFAGRICLVSMTAAAALTAAWTIARSQKTQAAEREFAAWYRIPDGKDLTFSDGWWQVRPSQEVQPAEDRKAGNSGHDEAERPGESY